MDTVLLLITAGLCAVSSHAERQYHFVYDRKTWTEAQSYCRENYTDLATVDNMEDMTTLNNMIDTSKLTGSWTWIGLYRGTYSWKWSLSDTSFYKHGETEFRRWRAGEPSNIFSEEHCTAMDEDGLWNGLLCSNSLKVVCSYVRGSDVTFILINKSMTWTEAQSHCRVNYTDLTSVRNMTENQKVQELIPAGERVWIGLFRDSWKWSDGSSSSFRYWLLGEPDNAGGNQHCVTANFPDFHYSGQWYDDPCNNRRASICYSTPTSQTTSSSTAGFSTPPHYLTTSSETQPESGLCAVSSHAERQYHFVYDRKTWTEAQSYCRERYTDLATVDNMEDVTTLNNMIDTSKIKSKAVWIGLYRGSWKWSLSNTSFYKHGETEFRRWRAGEPSNIFSEEHCTAMDEDGLWNGLLCSNSLKVVCSYVRGSDVTFILINKSMTWTEAQSHCRVNYTDLTSVRNMTENQKVQELIPAGERVWIGLFRDSWKWSDGSNSTCRHWIHGQPDNAGGNQHCVAADFGYSGQWRDLSCAIRRAFICYSTRLCAVSSHAERQYHFVYDLKNWTEAQSYCRENYTDLATVDNMEDVTTLNNTADTSKLVYPDGWNNAVWIGLYRGTHSWRWSLSDTSFYKHGETEFRRWRAGEPSNIFSEEHCTAMDEDGLWNGLLCSNSLKVVCSYVRGSDVTFILITKSMTWTEAQSHCRVNYTDLTSVRNMTENQKVQELIPAGERVWIGLFRDSWKWSDGSSSSCRHWVPGQPDGVNQHCVAADFGYSGQWRDLSCDNRIVFLCYSTPTSQTTSSSTAGFSTPPHYLTTSSETQPESATTKQVFRLKFHTQDSSLDLNDPAVMEDTLKKLKQKLKDQGLGDNIKLSWRKQPDGKVFHKEEKKKKKKKKTKKDEL